MPEGPEVRKYADALDEVLSGRVILSFAARTREARKWLEQNEQHIIGRRVEMQFLGNTHRQRVSAFEQPRSHLTS